MTLSQLLVLLVASLTAFAVSLYVIKLLTDYVKKHDFTVFGRYRIVLGSLLIVYSVFKSLFRNRQAVFLGRLLLLAVRLVINCEIIAFLV